MDYEILQGIIDTQKSLTESIKELLGICTILKDRVEALEEEIKKKDKLVYREQISKSCYSDHQIIRIEGVKFHDIDVIG